jgi:uncharacterized protein YkwD
MGGIGKWFAALSAAIALGCGLWVTAAPGRSSGASVTATAGRAASSVEAGIRACANRHRRAHGLRPLRHDHTLDRAARFHARRMLARGFFDHVDPSGRDPVDRVRRYAKHRYAIIGENIAAGQTSVSEACRDWMKRRGHRENILRPRFTRIGAGFARGSAHLGYYYVQVFADVSH